MGRWHLDEVFVSIAGGQMYLWRAVDDEGEVLDIPAEAINGYQPYWAVAAHLLIRSTRPAEAAAAHSRAIGLCENPAMREFLRRQTPPAV